MEKKDIRSFDFEIKSYNKKGVISGYASVFNNIDNHNDIISPEAIDCENIDCEDVKVLWQHDSSKPIGKVLSMYVDEVGLYVEIQLMLDIQAGDEAYKLVKQGVIKGMSIGFYTEDYDYKGDSRILKKIRLLEISIVTFPSNEKACISEVKNSFSSEEKELQEVLNDAITRLESIMNDA